MLVVETILGNMYNETVLKEKIEVAKQNSSLKTLFLSRSDMQKSRLRTETDDGMEIGLSFQSGNILQHGDILEIDSNIHCVVPYYQSDKEYAIWIDYIADSTLILY